MSIGETIFYKNFIITKVYNNFYDIRGPNGPVYKDFTSLSQIYNYIDGV